LIRLIAKEYRADIFDKSVLDADDVTLVNLILKRPFENPLCLLTDYTEETKDMLDDYYTEFMGTRYDDILRLSPFTSIGDYCMGFDQSLQEVTPYILCEVQEQEDYLQEKCNGYRYVAASLKTLGKLDDYDPIFVKSGFEYPIGSLRGHALYIARYGFNVSYADGKEYIDYAKAATIFSDSTIATIDVYGGQNERNDEYGSEDDIDSGE
jgi:hypothetical protein